MRLIQARALAEYEAIKTHIDADEVQCSHCDEWTDKDTCTRIDAAWVCEDCTGFCERCESPCIKDDTRTVHVANGWSWIPSSRLNCINFPRHPNRAP